MRERIEKLLLHTGDIALRRRAMWLIEQLEPEHGDRILDLGCGDGFYLHLLSNLNMNLKLVGLDNNPQALRSANKNLKGKRVKLLEGDVLQLPFKADSFDKVIASEVLEHVTDDVRGVQEMRRVIKPGGSIVITVPHADYPFLWDPVNFLLERLLGTHVASGFWAGIWNQHIRLYKRTQLKKLMEVADFKNIELTTLTHYCLPFNHHLINIGARFLARKNSQKAKAFLGKFSGPQNDSKSVFWPFFLFDRLNDLWDGKGSAVSLVAKAIK